MGDVGYYSKERACFECRREYMEQKPPCDKCNLGDEENE